MPRVTLKELQEESLRAWHRFWADCWTMDLPLSREDAKRHLQEAGLTK
jgi:hypothetical protein